MASSISLNQRRLLKLLSAALLDHQPEEELFCDITSTDWQEIIRLAEEQSILGLVINRLLLLPKELLPERHLRIELALKEELIAKHGRQHLSELQKVYAENCEEGFSPVLLKGATMSLLYPTPLLRSCGDIDLFFPIKTEYEQANQWAKSKGYKLQGESIYEQAYLRGRTMVENHLYLTYFGISKYDERLSEIVNNVQNRNEWTYVTIEGSRYRTLPKELNAVYIFHHILHHFSYLGIGFRQICDWLLFLRHHSQGLDLELFNHYAEQFDLLEPMKLFALMAKEYLNFPSDVFPFALPQDERSEKLATLILEDTFIGGNFGFEHFKGKKFDSIWSRRWFMFKRTALRSLKVAPISPEHIRMIPLIAIITRIKLLFR